MPQVIKQINPRYILSPYASSASQMWLQVTYLDSSENGEHAGENRHDPGWNYLENILVVVKITPGQIIALGLYFLHMHIL